MTTHSPGAAEGMSKETLNLWRFHFHYQLPEAPPPPKPPPPPENVLFPPELPLPKPPPPKPCIARKPPLMVRIKAMNARNSAMTKPPPNIQTAAPIKPPLTAPPRKLPKILRMILPSIKAPNSTNGSIFSHWPLYAAWPLG